MGKGRDKRKKNKRRQEKQKKVAKMPQANQTGKSERVLESAFQNAKELLHE
jgi:hypothetical protein